MGKAILKKVGNRLPTCHNHENLDFMLSRVAHPHRHYDRPRVSVNISVNLMTAAVISTQPAVNGCCGLFVIIAACLYQHSGFDSCSASR